MKLLYKWLLARRPFSAFGGNRTAQVAAWYLALCTVLAVLAPFIAPDNSLHANRQLLPMNGAPAGTSVFLISWPPHKGAMINLQNPVDFWLSGRKDQFSYIAASEVRDEGDSITYTEYGTSVPATIGKRAGMSTSRFTYWLGADRYGRDMLSRLLFGLRISLSVGLIAVAIAMGIGTLLGLLAGYIGGWADRVISSFFSIVWSLPTVLLVMAISLALGRGFVQLFIAIGCSMWVDAARMSRGLAISLREREFVDAARVLGYARGRILLRHVLPNMAGPMLVVAASNFATAVLLESGLSFLGVGVQPPVPSWGSMVSENFNYLFTGQPWLALVPGLAIMSLVISFNLVGNGLADIFQKGGSKL